MRQSPTYLALQRPRLAAGIGLKAIALIWPLGAIACILMETGWPLLVSVGAHVFLRWVYRRDQHILAIYIKYAQTSDHYAPGVYDELPGRERPRGYGRGVRC